MNGLWQVGQSWVEIDGRQIGLAALAPQPTTDEVIEEMMGCALLCFHQNGRRGTSEQIQWNITVDGVPHCYRCIEPMQAIEPRVDPAGARTAPTLKTLGAHRLAPVANVRRFIHRLAHLADAQA